MKLTFPQLELKLEDDNNFVSERQKRYVQDLNLKFIESFVKMKQEYSYNIESIKKICDY